MASLPHISLLLLILAASGSWALKSKLKRSPGLVKRTQLAPEGHSVGPQFEWGGLYPQETATRDRKKLDGVWNFRLSPKDDPYLGFNESWYAAPLSSTGPVIAMAVPSSYNDITQDRDIRDHVGFAWYDTEFFVSSHWQGSGTRVVLRFGSAHYDTYVYVNGQSATVHSGGHLPFMADITSLVKFGKSNLLTVAINNTLTPETIPQGTVSHKTDESKYPPGYFEQDYTFDFYNYAGIHRSVFLYTTPETYIDDVTVTTDVTGSSGSYSASLSYNVTTVTGSLDKVEASVECSVDLLDANGTSVVKGTGCTSTLQVANPKLWWPHLMDPNPGYLYTLSVNLMSGSDLVDSYYLKVGLRTIAWDNSKVTINGKQIYIRGCGKHEDSDIRGKGYDAALVVKDFSLLKWLGANAFRTSHYPYAEEIMDRADAEGIMVIDESPAVNLENFDSLLEDTHIAVMKELIARDKNRPSVIMWSLANEPRSQEDGAEDYFKAVAAATRSLDSTRPVTAVINQAYDEDFASKAVDVIWVNRYFAWYSDAGHLELIQRQMVSEVENWRNTHNKPIGISEYGAGTVAGLHSDPSFTWSEEYQHDLLRETHAAFDTLKEKGYFMGEMIWNFADFMTKQGSNRVVGNRKGVFTRTRQPKMAAFLLRDRYWALANASHLMPGRPRYSYADQCPKTPLF